MNVVKLNVTITVKTNSYYGGVEHNTISFTAYGSDKKEALEQAMSFISKNYSEELDEIRIVCPYSDK